MPAPPADPVKHDGYSMSLKADSSEGKRGPEGGPSLPIRVFPYNIDVVSTLSRKTPMIRDAGVTKIRHRWRHVFSNTKLMSHRDCLAKHI